MQAIFETIFDIVYLLTCVILGVRMIKKSEGNKQYKLFGIMSITLGLGDAIHLVPRALALNTTGLESFTVVLGIGKFITSITMTIFYIILYYIWRLRYDVKDKQKLTVSIYVLAAIRILLVLMPQNMWTRVNPPLLWGILRNIPFAIMGLVIIVLFYRSAKEHHDTSFQNMYLTIVLSFAFYIPVVLWGDVNMWIGMLMVPKTLAYVWTVVIGYQDMKQNQKLSRP